MVDRPRSARLVLSLLLLAASPAAAVEIMLEPVGPWAQIDIAPMRAAVRALLEGPELERARTVPAIRKTPERFAPPVLLALSRVLREQGDIEGALFWFHAGLLRARFDASRCADESARDAVQALQAEFDEGLVARAIGDDEGRRLERDVSRVVEWDRWTPHAYDQRWIILTGVPAVLAARAGLAPADVVLSLPRDRWDDLEEEARREYRTALVEDFLLGVFLRWGRVGAGRPHLKYGEIAADAGPVRPLPLAQNTALLAGASLLRAPDARLGPVFAGYQIVPTGSEVLRVYCGDAAVAEPGAELQAGHVYRLRWSSDLSCTVAPYEAAVVRGSFDEPAVWLVDARAKLTLQTTFTPGKREVKAVCRAGSRPEVVEQLGAVTLPLEPASIYELSAELVPTSDTCRLSARALAAPLPPGSWSASSDRRAGTLSGVAEPFLWAAVACAALAAAGFALWRLGRRGGSGHGRPF